MVRLMTTAAVLIAPANALTIPTQFAGEWCSISNTQSPAIYQRGSCSPDPYSDRKLTVLASRFEEVEAHAVQ